MYQSSDDHLNAAQFVFKERELPYEYLDSLEIKAPFKHLHKLMHNKWTLGRYACFPSLNCPTEDNLVKRFFSSSSHFLHP